jgi:hypothetical protein
MNEGVKPGITLRLPSLYTTKPKGAVKRFGGHINNIQRTMIIDADMPEEIWPYVVDTAIYINNRLVNLKTNLGMSHR